MNEFARDAGFRTRKIIAFMRNCVNTKRVRAGASVAFIFKLNKATLSTRRTLQLFSMCCQLPTIVQSIQQHVHYCSTIKGAYMPRLGVTIDHIATMRQARGGREPDPVHAAVIAELAGCHSIVVHLREDRRAIQDRDVYLLKQTLGIRLNLQIAPTPEMIQIAADIAPFMVTLVPERREERTTESGLAVRGKERDYEKIVDTFRERNVLTSLFIDPDIQQIRSAARTGATQVELNAGAYANAGGQNRHEELSKLQDAAIGAHKYGVYATTGVGLTYQNAGPVSELEFIAELIIGHAVISRAALTGLDRAVRDMLTVVL